MDFLRSPDDKPKNWDDVMDDRSMTEFRKLLKDKAMDGAADDSFVGPLFKWCQAALDFVKEMKIIQPTINKCLEYKAR
jgi:hypothetical protein